MELDPQVSVRIRNAAARCNGIVKQMENTRDPEKFKELQKQLDAAEQQMVEASMVVNRGIHRPNPG